MNRIDIDCKGIDAGADFKADRIESFCSRVLKKLGIEKKEISLLFCDDAFIRQLNRDYRGIDKPTDVLSFQQGDSSEYCVPAGTILLGDVVISMETLFRNARDYNIAPEEEMKRLIVHGILHLSGMDHGHKDYTGDMLELQEKIIKEFLEVNIF